MSSWLGFEPPSNFNCSPLIWYNCRNSSLQRVAIIWSNWRKNEFPPKGRSDLGIDVESWVSGGIKASFSRSWNQDWYKAVVLRIPFTPIMKHTKFFQLLFWSFFLIQVHLVSYSQGFLCTGMLSNDSKHDFRGLVYIFSSSKMTRQMVKIIL